MTKPRLATDVVRCLVQSQFPQWAHLEAEPVARDGWDNHTFRLGDDMSVRLPSADAYAPQVGKEQRWLPALAAGLPLPIPQPLARGEPGCGFPRPWSVYRWLAGAPASLGRISDLTRFAADLAAFLSSFHALGATAGPPAGEHSFFRGGSLSVYDAQTRALIEELADEFDPQAATAVWEEALASRWSREPVWVHGDVTAANLLVVDGRLAGVIDFGCMAVGDPACDLAIAWTLLEGPSRSEFRAGLGLDSDTWARGRGWALWKALLTRAEARRAGGDEAAWRRYGWRTDPGSLVAELLADC